MTTDSNKPNGLFWAIGVIAIIWNAMGVMAYLAQAYKTESFEAMYTPEQLDIINNMPAWATAAFATAVFGGVLGSLLLLLKKRLANIVAFMTPMVP